MFARFRNLVTLVFILAFAGAFLAHAQEFEPMGSGEFSVPTDTESAISEAFIVTTFWQDPLFSQEADGRDIAAIEGEELSARFDFIQSSLRVLEEIPYTYPTSRLRYTRRRKKKKKPVTSQ